MTFRTLVSVADLAVHLEDPQWVVCDCRHDLANYEAGRRAYAQSHIPGARFFHLDEDLSGPKTGANGRHPLPHPITFTLRLGALGIDNSKQIVAYDASGGCYAARLWWMLRWVGHQRVAVLDGGWDAWMKAGKHAVNETIAVGPATFNPNLQPQQAVNAGFIQMHLERPEVCVLDARSPERFRGENETLDPVAGHIPGALNRFFRLNLDERGRFKSAADLGHEFRTLLDGRQPESVIHQCGSGVTACHNLLAMEVAGLGGSRLYPGSWSEWVADPSRPVATETRPE
ncbi:MAG: sulfurtransferase [Betaproteobacteria bacterium]|nr:sulfurtransferase [Betaproteobacteria bacterium]